MALALIDTDTGETLRTVEIEEGDSVRLIHKTGRDANYDTFPFSSFIKLNGDEVKYLSVELTKAQFSFMVSVLPYLSYRDNCIKDGRGKPMNVAQIADRLSVTRNTANRLINELIDEDLLCRAKNSSEYQLYVNPWFAGKGNLCNNVLASMFRNYRIRSMGGRQWNNLTKTK